MASSYPGGLDNFSTSHQDDVDEIIHASTVNDNADAINKIEAELGTNPKGSAADVKTRIANTETVANAAIPSNYLDTDGTLAADSDTKVATQKATKTYVDAAVAGGGGGSGSTITANTQTVNYTLVLTDAGKVVEMNSASAITLTVPPHSSVAWPDGTMIEVYAMGAGVVTVAAGGGVTVRNVGALAGQYKTARLRYRTADEWVLSGELA